MLTDADYSSTDLVRPHLYPPFSPHTRDTGKSFGHVEKPHRHERVKTRKPWEKLEVETFLLSFGLYEIAAARYMP